jgi:hypothetical protein
VADPVLALPVFAATVMVTVPLPVPLVGDRFTQSRLSDAVHSQLELEAFTKTVSVPPLGVKVLLDDDRLYVQVVGSGSWLIE